MGTKNQKSVKPKKLPLCHAKKFDHFLKRAHNSAYWDGRDEYLYDVFAAVLKKMKLYKTSPVDVSYERVQLMVGRFYNLKALYYDDRDSLTQTIEWAAEKWECYDRDLVTNSIRMILNPRGK